MIDAPLRPVWARFHIHDEGERAARWALWSSPEVGPARAWDLVTQARGQVRRLFEDPALAASVLRTIAAPRPREALSSLLQPHTLDWWTVSRDALLERGGSWVDAWSCAYPSRLERMRRPPMFLSVLGKLREGPRVAIVGSRRGAGHLESFTQTLAADLSAAGLQVWSGGALGLDAAAHRGAIEAGTTAILASGVLRPTPRSHDALFRRMIAGQGALVSERALEAQVRRSSYQRRNAVLAAWVDAVVVVRAAQRSGTWLTAQAARTLDTPVFVVPNGPGARALGSEAMLRRGDLPVWEAQDVLDAMGFAEVLAPGGAAPASEPLETRDPPQGEAGRVLAWLEGRGHVGVDEIGHATRLGPAEVAGLLLGLELEGWVSREPGAPRYKRLGVVR